MVNTFLTSPNYRESAHNLDRARLGKQRVEAMQILHLIQDLRFLGEDQGDPLPLGSSQYDWIRRIAKRYKSEPTQYLVKQIPKNIKGGLLVDRMMVLIPKSTAQKIPSKSKRPKTIIIDGIQIDPADRPISLGFCYHPIVQMWLGYEDALKLYINAHIEEFIDRGYDNHMRIYTIPDVNKVEHPMWTQDSKLHQNHRASLLLKEMQRSEEPWYRNKEEFTNAGSFVDYIWYR